MGGASVLQTSDPQAAGVQEVDTADSEPLAGFTILVVEDDFYQAEDARQTFEFAGAHVLGPYSVHTEAREAIGQNRPDCALLDVNLGAGPDFELAASLNAEGVSLLFITGYDSKVLPPELSHVRCLRKPTTGRLMVQAVRDLCSRPST